MYKRLTLALIAALAGCFCGYASAAGIVSDIPPVTAIHGKADQISLSLPQWQAGARLNLQPSGPVIVDRISLDNPATQIVHRKSMSYAVVNNSNGAGEVIAIQWDAKAKIVARHKVAGHIRFMKLNDKYIVIAIDNQGIEWLDISSPAKIRHSGFLKINGFLNALSVRNNQLAYTKQHNSIQLLSLSESKSGDISASRQKTIHVSHPINDLWVSSELIYVASEKTGLTLFDISQPRQTTMLSGFKTTGSALSLQIDGHLVYVADGSGGLTILDISNPKSIIWRGSHSKLGSVNNIWINEKLAIINNAGNRLANLNIDKPELPITQSLYKPKQTIHAVALSGSTVFLASGNEILKLENFQVAAAQISHSGVNQGGSRRAYIDNDIAYVADWFSGLHIYDIRIPHQPRHLGNFRTPGSSKGVVVRNSIAYIGDDDHGLQIVDVSNPRAPVKISEVLTTGLAYTLKLVNDRVYLADHRGGFHIIDVSDIHKPKIIGSFDTPGKSWALDVKDNLVFVADDLSGLLVFDLSNPTAPKQVGQFSPGGYAEDVLVADNIAYVTFFDKGLYLVDISNPEAISEISHIDIPGNARSIAVQNNYAYVSGWESGLQIIDVSRQKHLDYVGYIDTDGSTWGADIKGNYAYLWDWWGGIKVVDIRHPRRPALVGRYQGRSRIQQLQKINNYAYSANGSSGMQVFDISNPLNPIWVTALELTGFANDLTLTDRYAYLSLGDAGISKVNISDPFNPRWLSSLTTSGYSQSIQQYNGYLYVAQKSAGIDIIDAKSDLSMNPVGQLPISANDLIRVSDKLIVAHNSDISSYSLRQPGKPIHTQTLSLNNRVKQLSHENNIVAALRGKKSIQLFRITDNGLRPLHQFQHSEVVNDILLHDGQLYIYSNNNGLTVTTINSLVSVGSGGKNTSGKSNQENLTFDIQRHYPSTGQYQAMLAHKNAMLFSGQSSIASVELLPAIKWQATTQQQIQLSLPNNLPMGAYHVELELASGLTFLYPNLIQVIPGKRKKPQMSMELFQKLLKQHTQKQPSPTSSSKAK